MYILILGESSTRGLPNKHGLLSSQLIRQPTGPTSAHTTTEIVFFLFFDILDSPKHTLPPHGAPPPNRYSPILTKMAAELVLSDMPRQQRRWDPA